MYIYIKSHIKETEMMEIAYYTENTNTNPQGKQHLKSKCTIHI